MHRHINIKEEYFLTRIYWLTPVNTALKNNECINFNVASWNDICNININ